MTKNITQQIKLPRINSYALVNKYTGEVTMKNIRTREEARMLREYDEKIVKFSPVGFVR